MVATNSAHFITLFFGSFREKTKSIHFKSFFFAFYGLKNSTNFRIFAWNLTFFPYFSHHSTLKKFTCPSKSCFFMTLPIEFLQKISKYTSYTFLIFSIKGQKLNIQPKLTILLIITHFKYLFTSLFFLQVYTYFILKLSSWPKESENTQFTADLYPKNKIIVLWKIALFTPFL